MKQFKKCGIIYQFYHIFCAACFKNSVFWTASVFVSFACCCFMYTFNLYFVLLEYESGLQFDMQPIRGSKWGPINPWTFGAPDSPVFI